MKKLMIALTAVAAAVLVAKADPTSLGGEDFEKMSEGATITTPSSYWIRSNDAEAGDSVVAVEDDNKYLKVEETEVLQRTIMDQNDTEHLSVAIPDNGGSIVISSKVQFTATDDAEITPDEGAKLAIWLKKTEADPENGVEEEALTLMVTAADESGNRKHYPTSVEVEENTWYNLVVTSTKDSEGIAQFKVTVGETLIDQTFGSLDRSSGAADTITSVGFKGTGAVDNIAFSEVEGVQKAVIWVTGADDGLASVVTVDGAAYDEETGAEVDATKTAVAIVVTPKAGYTVTNEGAVDNQDGTFTVTVDATEAEEGELIVEITTQAIGPTPEPIQPTIKPEGATVDGLPKGGFVIGTEYDTADFTVTPAEHKTATVVVKVNGEVVEGKFTLKAGDTVEITVTEADITHKLTIPTVEGATAAVTDAEGVEVADITAIVEGTVVTVTWTAQDGYKLTDGSLIEEVTMNADQEAQAPTFTAITYATVTVDADAGVKSVTLTVNGEKIDPATYKADVDDAVVVAVAYELNDKKVLADGCTVPETVTLTENATITIRTDDEQDPESTRPTDIEGGSTEQKAAYDEWAKGKDLTGKTDAQIIDAFILNADVTATAAELETKLGAEISADMVAALAAGEKADFTALKAKYPNATFEFVEYKEIETSAKLYKLTAKFVPANATK